MTAHWLVAITCLLIQADAAKILTICPHPSYSHQQQFHGLQMALASRGHDVTIVTSHPIKNAPDNYKQIDVSFTIEVMRKMGAVERITHSSAIDFLDWYKTTPTEICRVQLESPHLQSLIKSNETFDAVILEILAYPCYYGVIHALGSPPLIGLSPLAAQSPIMSAIGNPVNPSYMADFMVPFTDHMTLWQRVYNTMVYFKFSYVWLNWVVPLADENIRKYVKNDLPCVYETESNFSLIIVNHHTSMRFPRPSGPTIVEIKELHIKKNNTPLPQNIQKFLDEAEEGAIYFSLGSQIRSQALEGKVCAFLEAFSELPQKILWKWDAGSLPGAPDNVMTVKWAPQQDILAHNNVKAFITQGGLQSLQEAVHHAVPVVVIPFIADQPQNAVKMHTLGVGVHLSASNITKEAVLWSLRSLLNNASYSKKIEELSSVFRDDPQPSLDRAVWWIEYIIRHRGAPHLRSPARDMPWLRQSCLDIFFLAVTVLGVVTAFIYKALKRTSKFRVRPI